MVDALIEFWIFKTPSLFHVCDSALKNEKNIHTEKQLHFYSNSFGCHRFGVPALSWAPAFKSWQRLGTGAFAAH
jgi:hypothetical protein